MGEFPFRPTSQDLERIARDVAAIPAIQRLLENAAPDLRLPDRVAHQFQIAGGKVRLRIDEQLPDALEGVGLFEPGAEHIGVGRLSTGLGCPHPETEPDFLGIRLAFQTANGRRVDFLAINDPGAPTDTHPEFIRLLEATAAGAGKGLVGSNVALVASLTHSLGLRGDVIAAHVAAQTARTAASSTAYQTYWTGIVEMRGRPAKFAIVPLAAVNSLRSPTAGVNHLSDEWSERQARGPIEFDLYWLDFVDARATSLDQLMRGWEERRVHVGRVVFPQCDPTSGDARSWAALAAEMRANPGNWVADPENSVRDPATEFGVARKIAYGASQDGRNALLDEQCTDVFRSGAIGPALALELERRRAAKREAGHVDAAFIAS